MTQWLTLSRAARLIGVPRGVLQREIRDGRLAANDGMVSTAGLLRALPAAESGGIRRVRARREAEGGGVRTARAGARAAGPRGAGATAVRAEPGTRRRAPAPAALSRARRRDAAAHRRRSRMPRPSPRSRELRALLEHGLAEVLATESADPLAIMDDMLKIVSAHVDRAAERPRVLRRRARHAAAGRAQGRAQAQLRLRQRHLRAVQGARHLRRRDQGRCRPTTRCPRPSGCRATRCCARIRRRRARSCIETLEAHGPGEIPEQEIAVRVRSVQPLAPDTLLLHLQTPRTTRLRFLAGQSVTL